MTFSFPNPMRRKRHAAEFRFRLYGILALVFSFGFLFLMLLSVVRQGYGAFWQTQVTLSVFFDPVAFRRDDKPLQESFLPLKANYQKLALKALENALEEKSSHILPPARELRKFLSEGAGLRLRTMVMKDPSTIGKTVSVHLPVSGDIDSAFKGLIDLSVSPKRRKVSDLQILWMKHLAQKGSLRQAFNVDFFFSGPSSRPETSGILVALIGSFYILCSVLVFALPVGVAAGIYLEEFSRKNRFVEVMEVTVNNLAAVPSVVFGLLGLAVFVNFLGVPRSSALAGGLTLALMTLPVIIVVTRASLAAVPLNVRLTALALGASKLQAVFHHVLPLAVPGILTGAIIGLARALGETAPLLIIGMVAFVADTPRTPLDPATALPVQIYMWANQAERSFTERTYAVIIILLALLMLMNFIAIVLRNRLRKV